MCPVSKDGHRNRGGGGKTPRISSENVFIWPHKRNMCKLKYEISNVHTETMARDLWYEVCVSGSCASNTKRRMEYIANKRRRRNKK